MSGFIVMHEDDQSIADFQIRQDVPNPFFPFLQGLYPAQQGEGSTIIAATTTYFKQNGPTNFSVTSDFGSDQFTDLRVTFSRGTGGSFNYMATYENSIYMCWDETGCRFRNFSGIHYGTASRGEISKDLIAYLDSMGGYTEGVYRTVPTYIGPGRVPEPGSFALLAIGALGVAGLRRRKPQ